MTNYDPAILFTLAYLQLLERHLKVTWNDAGIPICLLDWITDESIANLRTDLAELMTGELECGARKAVAEYGVDHVQTVGFGLAPDFDQFIKLGLVYGDRVVLWDVIYSRIMAGKQYKSRKSLIAQIACELLMLKAVVERGSVVLLAHPIAWSLIAAEVDDELRANGPIPTASFGLSMAFAAIEEGLVLHPYTLLSDSSSPQLAMAVEEADHELFSRENFRFQQCLTVLLQDERVAYLENVPIEAYLDVLSEHGTLRRAIRHLFLPALGGLSSQQASQEIRALIDDLFELFGKRNSALTDYVADGVDATAAFVLASASVVLVGQPLLSALAALGAPAVALSTAVRKWVGKPTKNVIIQAFRALEESATRSQIYDPADIGHRIAVLKEDLACLNDYYRQFISYHWTEDRHFFLESLSPEIAKEVLGLLRPEDISSIVNMRQFQHAYIGDYLAYISDLDEAIYWEHLTRSFDSPEGFLVYDDDANIQSMEQLDVPLQLWRSLLNSLFTVYSDEMKSGIYNYPLERFPNVVHFQTMFATNKDEKRSVLLDLASNLCVADQQALKIFLNKAFDGELPAWFT
ncbi:hypothetical protein [Methylomonas fluvii]|uniref:Uncharacterized protein n=1 Tax=Methylomonas fluvii TaxID=1854564 RepID=A0ABR9DEK4_9GAMM|nr:hypothetical protein [Methylomonas fluvii]MBD9361529.1 hypothetical protein [Methylomonas fluvii]